MSKIEIGSRVLGSGKKGVVVFIGDTSFSAGEWIGIKLDNPDGKNDGSVAGVKYFECPMDHGLFVKRAQCKLLESEEVKESGSSNDSRSKLAMLRAKRDGANTELPKLKGGDACGSTEGEDASSTLSSSRAKIAALRAKRESLPAHKSPLKASDGFTDNLVKVSETETSEDNKSSKFDTPEPKLPSQSTEMSVKSGILDKEQSVVKNAEISTLKETILRLQQENRSLNERLQKMEIDLKSDTEKVDSTEVEALRVQLQESRSQAAISESRFMHETDLQHHRLKQLEDQIEELNGNLEALSLDKESLALELEAAEEQIKSMGTSSDITQLTQY